MLYNPPTGSTDPNAPYVGKNTAAGTQGSRVPPKAIEMTQRELVAIITEGLLSPTNDDPRQAMRAIRSGRLWTFDDAGTQNHLWVQSTTPHTTVFKGLPFRIWPAYTNTAAAYLRVNLLPEVPIVRRDGSALQPGDIVAGVPTDLAMDGLGNMRLVGLAHGEVPRRVPAPVLYVRPDGNDSNDGSANDAAHAFLTIAAAAQYGANKLYLIGTRLRIQLGIPGTYAAPGALSGGAISLLVQGDDNNPSSYVISGAGPGNNNGVIGVSGGANLTLSGVKVVNTGYANNTVCAFGGFVGLVNVVISSTIANPTNFAHLCASSGGAFGLSQNVTFSGGMAYCLYATNGYITLGGGNTFTIAGNPNFTYAFAAADTCGVIANAGGTSFSGTAIGTRYAAATNGVISTVGSGPNFFPGSISGFTASGGQYA